jgi:hypothetical protein
MHERNRNGQLLLHPLGQILRLFSGFGSQPETLEKFKRPGTNGMKGHLFESAKILQVSQSAHVQVKVAVKNSTHAAISRAVSV